MLLNLVVIQQSKVKMIINLDSVPFLDAYLKTAHYDLRETTNHGNFIKFYYTTEESEYCKNNDVYLVLMNRIHFDFDLDLIVPTDIIEKIKNKEVILALDFLGECFTHIIYEIYEHLVDRQNIPPSQILLIEHSPDIPKKILNYCREYNKEPIKYEVFYMLEKMIQRAILIEMNLDTGYNKPVFPNVKSPLLQTSFNKKFIFLNRIWRRHRTMMLMLLEKENLLEQGHVSFFNMSYWPGHVEELKEKFVDFNDVIDSQSNIVNKLPIVLDTPVFEPAINKFRRNMIKFYNETYFSIITETSYDQDSLFFPTEKVFKPIMHKHPFVIIGTPHYLKKLRELGYRTFDGIIDESYDDIVDDNKRMQALINEVKRLCNLSDSELLDFRNKALEIVEHNYTTLTSKSTFLTKLL